MKRAGGGERWTFGELSLPVHSLNTLVVGSGAAARNAALQLLRRGVSDVAIATDRWNAGTSFNAGSDKQTYYKVALAGQADSPVQLARDLRAGGCMHGDIALCEAAGSTRAFFNLVELGVPFPHDRHGGFPGYRTDNDSRGRATSAGPLTSQLMCQALEGELERWDLRIFDGHQVVALLTREGEGDEGRSLCGAVAFRKEGVEGDDFGLVVFNATNVILATGGPGGMYRDSVYPQSQRGALGMGLRAGAVAQNLTESQFGLASVGFRWNLSGSYQQVIPRYISTDASGGGEREFLNEHFPHMETLANATFRKGYEWPFDAQRLPHHGSSLIDLLVHRERVARRRVFLDFTRNPGGGDALEPFRLDHLNEEARSYLEASGALQESPIARLEAMNPPAVQLFRDHGRELGREPLEIAVCAQHTNGGLRANLWWESNVKHLFPIGEVCGTHGVRRPGGAALNAGQVGGMRAADFIAEWYRDPPPSLEAFGDQAADQVRGVVASCLGALSAPGPEGALTPAQVISTIQERMSEVAGHIRNPLRVREARDEAAGMVAQLPHRLRITDRRALTTALWAADLCLTHLVFLEALQLYLENGGGSRASALVLDPGGELPARGLEEEWRHAMGNPESRGEKEILEIWVDGEGELRHCWVSPRPLPEDTGWFEEVWREFREGRIVRWTEG